MIQNNKNIRDKTIKDFGNQFNRFSNIQDNYWAHIDHLNDLLGDCIEGLDLKDKEIAEVGAGSGRNITIFSKLNPKRIIAIEPSSAFNVLKNNTSHISNLELINKSGSDFTLNDKIDIFFSLGVIHHIIDPIDVLNNIFNNLNENGELYVSVYAKENNYTLIAILKLFSFLKLFNDSVLEKISIFLNYILQIYIFICRIPLLNLPMKNYLIARYSKNSFYKQTEIIFDQLNTTYAKFYSKQEIVNLIEEANFEVLKVFNSANNSWGIKARKLNE